MAFNSADRAVYPDRMGEGGGVVDVLTAAGIGLDYGIVRLDRTTSGWLSAGAQLRQHVVEILESSDAVVEHVGSSSVPGILAKPIVDIAVGIASPGAYELVDTALGDDGWIYRGDAGDEGGHVWVLDSHPQHRVAHIHVVDHNSLQWKNYIRFRDLLGRSPEACAAYEAVKVALASSHHDDREAYTAGKSSVVQQLLATAGDA